MKLTKILICSMVVTCLSAPALAALGGDAASVEADRASMKGALRVTPTVDYAMHEIHANSGLVVHEYVSAQGKVFAVTWRGPGRPDLAQLLGSYSAQLAQAAVHPHYNHHHLILRTPGVVLESTAHARTFSGRAWAPALLPQNFSLSDIG